MAGGAVLAVLGTSGSLLAGYRGYARAFGGLAHFALLFVPLMALFPTAASIAEDRENGTLEYVLAQPVTWGQVYLGKWTGMAIAVTLALTAGYLATGGVAVARGVPASLVLATYGFLVLLSLVFTSIGLLISALSDTRSRAVTVGLALWLLLVVLGSLGAMAALIRWGAPADLLVAWSVVNPVEAFRLAVMVVLDPDLQILGPVGVELVRRHGPAAVVAVTTLSLGLWTVTTTLAGWWVAPRLRRSGA
jgi:ABC-type transport system involved in multi-copper enzyme maturation permease subunit